MKSRNTLTFRELLKARGSSQQFKKWLTEYIDSGLGPDGKEDPHARHLSEKLLKTLRPAARPFVMLTRTGFEWFFRGSSVEETFLRFLDSDLRYTVHICRYCGKWFHKEPMAKPYSNGIHCSQRCKSSHSVEEGKRRVRVKKLEICQEVYLWAWNQWREEKKIKYSEIDDVAKNALARKGVSKKFYTDHLEEITDGA